MVKVFSNFTYFIKIFGCQMNYADAERVASTLSASGGEITNKIEDAKLVVALSCGVRHGAEERIIQWIKKTKKENKKAKIILTGCLSHREDVRIRLDNITNLFVPIAEWSSDLLFCHPELVSGSSVLIKRKMPKLAQIPKQVRDDMVRHDNLIKKSSCVGFYELKPNYINNHRVYIPIMTGCNNFCAYCVVPYARGREISRGPESILHEIKTCLRSGAKEIYLLGQNVASYNGADNKGIIWNFAKLLKKVDNLPGNFWIKFVSSHPKDIDSKFIKAFAEAKKVSPNLHLPVQSGNDRILKAMNRQYQRQDYLATIKKVLEARSETVFSSDIIVGFPGENDIDFQDSVDIVNKSQFEMLYALKYSPRPETAASKLENNVPASVKKERQRILDQTWKKIALKKNQRFLGKNIKILIDKIKEKQDKNGKKMYIAVGKNFENKDVSATVSRYKNHDILGKWGIVKIKKAESLGLQGELVRVIK